MAALVITLEIEDAVMQVAHVTGQTPAQVLEEAVRRQVQATVPVQQPVETSEEREARMKRIYEIVRRLQAHAWNKDMSADEALGYDEFGLPTN